MASVVDACSFASWNNAAQVENFAGVSFTRNVVAWSYRTAFDVDARSAGVKLVGNLVAGKNQAVPGPGTQLCTVRAAV